MALTPALVEPIMVNIEVVLQVSNGLVTSYSLLVITLITPAGIPASMDNSAQRNVARGVICEGLIIAVQPDAKTGPNL